MARNSLGDLRRSAAAALFGPGAIIDFRAGKATISAVAAGLEQWDSNFPPAGMLHPQAIREERLQRKLNVKGFRLPPVRDPSNDRDAERALVAVRFPHWLQCPQCDRIGEPDLWLEEAGNPGRWCQQCTQKAPGRQKVYTVPVRFVMACESGHLDEFPWHYWVNHEDSCRGRRGFLMLRSEGPGIAGLILTCPVCNRRKSMDRIFSAETWSRSPDCPGKRPWLGGNHEACNHKPRAVQRGASNLYFPIVESALSIPPWSDRLQEAIGVYWDSLESVEAEDRATHIRILATSVLGPVLQELNLSPEQLALEVNRRLSNQQQMDVTDLRVEEYRQFTSEVPVEGLDREFEIRPQPVPDSLTPWFSRLVKAVRLREVRAMTGFTRIQPPGDPSAPSARLSITDLGWLPAIEVRGEGIFLEFDATALEKWEQIQAVRDRASKINNNLIAEWESRHDDGTLPSRTITPRFLLIHTFAHALMRQMTLDCGYSSTALRERLYAADGSSAMAGVLIFTASTDDDGTLGGLQRQGAPERIERTVLSAVQSQEWCSSDPLCIEDMMSDTDPFLHAACHSCVLAPETSCEEFNRFLDRATLVGSPGLPELGFFSQMLKRTSL
jgi:hypothetical protein